jgi:ethanolamine utilization microcompartment shell protein EutL
MIQELTFDEISQVDGAGTFSSVMTDAAAGALVGGAIGFLVGGPAGAVIGAADGAIHAGAISYAAS